MQYYRKHLGVKERNVINDFTTHRYWPLCHTKSSHFA